MTRKTGKIENINSNLGKIILYQSEDGHTSMDVHLKDDNRLVDLKSDGGVVRQGQIRYFPSSWEYFPDR